MSGVLAKGEAQANTRLTSAEFDWARQLAMSEQEKLPLHPAVAGVCLPSDA